ncbi:hypothetical protein A2Y99_04280 [Candidatus Gottesmanbacteria bacterium RBG_13_37_7]|uniref:ABC transporter domain-containing protein n=1 Tax=Candidatus Gottesmanbacteria bacterium RBG_13_37_7 TaxID=1798369 RepID=A0A1F5YHW9_9BACT|nr:MAG: hypothetical protein A2Y99_04280 [Candidatus Gottesmanbacteria bacterium RBG_13_37_7]
MVSVANISKSFGNIKAVDDLSFSVKSGEIVGLLGPNGAGKTTTMRLMTGYLTPDAGRIAVNNIDVMENPTLAQKQIGYLPENNPLYKDMLVGELLEYSFELKDIAKKDKKNAFDFAVINTGIKDIYYRPVSELSKGYKQRLGIAICLLHKPSVLIMDEPTEGLDPNQRTEIRALIKTLSKDHTIIMSTHVMQEVEAVCNRMIVINRGKLVADGTPRQLTKIAHPGQILYLEVEGKNIEKHLQNIKGVKSMTVAKRGNRESINLTVENNREIQPEISKLIRKYGWILWSLHEEEVLLEDVFHELTK